MAGSATDYLQPRLLSHTLAFGSYAAPTSAYVALTTSPPSSSTPGLEVAGGGSAYVRQLATFALSAGRTDLAINTATVEFPQAARSWGVIGYFELWDAVVGGNRLYWGALVDPSDNVTPLTLTVSAGDIVRFSVGTLGVQTGAASDGTAPSGAWLPLSGGQLTGPLYLAGDPVALTQAATKNYVDTRGGGGGGGTGYLPLSGGTLLPGASLGFTGSGAITGFGTDIGQAPVYSNYNATGIPAIAYASRHIHYKSGGTSSADFWTHDFIRTATHTTSGAQAIVGNMRVSSVIPAGDGDSEWNFLAQTTTNATSTAAQAIGGTFQGTKNPGSKSSVWAGIFSAIDLTLQSSSAATGALAALEIDVRASAVDDGPNLVKYGGAGLRQHIQMSNKRQDTSTDSEVSTNIFITAAEPLYARSLTVLGFGQGYQVYQVVDTRGTAAPTGYPDPPAAVRMSSEHVIDFNGGATLKSRAGNYLQYTKAGTPRLRYMAGTTEVWSVSDAGVISGSAASSVSADVASKNVSIATPYDAYGTDAGNFGNTAGGYQALAVFVGGAGHNNTAFGQSAMAVAVSALAETAVGSNALAQDTNGSFNTAVGSNAGWVIQGGFGSTALGHGALGGDDFVPAPNTGGQNTALGGWSGQEITTGTGNTFAGASSGLFLTTGSHNVAAGAYALAGGAGITATAIGNAASYNVALGESALRNTTVSFLTAVGWEALKANTTGLLHAAFGRSALSATVADTRHTAFGANAAQNVNGVSNVTAFGAESQKNNTAGADNTTVGSRTASVLTTGQGNTILGNSGGFVLTTGAFNLLLGNKVGSTTLVTGSNNILIGINQNCDTDTAATSNTFRVTGATTTPIIDAINTNSPSNPLIRFPGSIQIGVPSFLSTQPGELGFDVLDNTQIVGSGAPGAIGAKLLFKCGTNPGTAALVAKAGTSSTIVMLLDNIGSGVAGC